MLPVFPLLALGLTSGAPPLPLTQSIPARFSGLKYPTIRKPASHRKSLGWLWSSPWLSLPGPPWVYTWVISICLFQLCHRPPIPLPPLLRAWRLVLEEVRGLALAGRDQVPVGAAAILARHPAAPPPISGLLGGTCRGCSTSAPLFKYNAPIFLVLKAVGLPLHLQCVETNSPPSNPRSSVMG